MFTDLVKLLFPSIDIEDSKGKANYCYFEETKNAAKELQEEAINNFQSSLAEPANNALEVTQEETYQKKFYAYLFGESTPVEQHDELSLFVTQQVEKLLKQPKEMLKSLPVLPVSLSKILEQLNKEEFDTAELIDLIQHEAVIAAKVIELANSTYYNRSHKEIVDLKSAFMLLGANGLMEGVINGFVSNLSPESHIYFRQYGNKIWEHSLSTGQIAKALVLKSSYKDEAAQAYFIGLVSNLGNMIIYQLLIEAFSFVHPDCQPNSFAFKELMYRNAKKITYCIAKYWHFPQSIIDVLALQAKLTKPALLSSLSDEQHLARYIYEANIISMLALRFEKKQIDQNELDLVQAKLVHSTEAKDYIKSQFNLND